MCNFLRTVSFPLTWSSAYGEFSFDNLAANFGTNGRWSSAECPETVQKFFLPRKTFLTLGRIVCCFDNACSKCLTTGQFFFSSLSENEEKVIIFFLICFPQIVPTDKWNAVLTIVTKISWKKAGEMFTNCPKMIRNFNFSKTIKFSPTCSSAHVECNFDNSWKSFSSRPKKFVQLPRRIEKVQYLWKFFCTIVPMDSWNESILANPMKILKQKA